MKTGFITINCEEFSPDETFKGFEVHIKTFTNDKIKKRIHKFDTGDPIVDNYIMSMFIETVKNVNHFGESSSVNHFYMDSKKYSEKVVVFNEDYSEGEIMDWQLAQKRGYNIDELVKVCVTDEFKTFTQLKAYVKSKVPTRFKKFFKNK